MENHFVTTHYFEYVYFFFYTQSNFQKKLIIINGFILSAINNEIKRIHMYRDVVANSKNTYAGVCTPSILVCIVL